MDQNLRLIEECLCTWILQSYNVYMCNEKQFRYADVLNALNVFIEKFKPKKPIKVVPVWLNELKARYNLPYVGIIVKPSIVALQGFNNRFMSHINRQHLCPAQVFIVDEAGLYWKINNSPGKPEMITFLTCANVTGTHKLKPLVIGKVKNPKELENTDLPIHYYSHRSGWITRRLFEKWFFECFLPEVKEFLKEQDLPQTALLLLFPAACHPSTVFLNKEDNFPSLLLPNNSHERLSTQIVLNSMKKNYKDSILRMILQRESFEDLSNFNLKDMASLLLDCWKAVPASDILSAFDNINLNNGKPMAYNPSYAQAYGMMGQICERFYVSADYITTWYEGEGEERNGSQFFSEEEIADTAPLLYLEEGDVGAVDSKPKVELGQALKSIEYCIRWAEEEKFFCSEIALLRRMRVDILKTPFSNSKLKRSKTAEADDESLSKLVNILKTPDRQSKSKRSKTEEAIIVESF
ncbi:jerky protein homolog-like [Colias croceus]|uniref:jerky protein homolog-like n=1 Tax=Colias crocea TaxID=72248 RepID=UPI001E27DB4E|nr:jerky protein homolog-like [Colias croceus]XP_045499562.1 jerky protein homolog-like [Colias croceus]